MYADQSIGVVVTSVGAPRRNALRRALESVWAQTLQPEVVVIAQDTTRGGAARTRQRGTDAIHTDYVAYLDDDDELYPQHLHRLVFAATRTWADIVYPWYDVEGGQDPFPWHEGQPWDDEHPHQVPVTFLARTEAIRSLGGWYYDETTVIPGTDPGMDHEGNRAGEDYQLILRAVQAGMRIEHLPERTWRWHHHGKNSSGLPSRVDWSAVE